MSAKKKPKLDNGNVLNTDIGADNMANVDQTSTRSNSTEQQLAENTTSKRNKFFVSSNDLFEFL